MHTHRTTTPARSRMPSRILVLLAVLALALAATACGDDSADSASDGGSSMDMSGAEDHDFAFGEPADAADADRTVEVEASDDFAFDPASVEVEEGETVTFEVTNTGQILHAFVIGDEDAQTEHEAEMQEMASEDMDMEHGDPNAIDIEPGSTNSITWHFTEAGEVLYGCHQPGHYDAGMVGSITVG